MATIDIGKLTFTHKGDYASGTAYVLNDVVYYNGSAYIAKQSTTGNVPTNTTYWSTFTAGSGGIYDGSLSIGSANQILQVNSGGTALEFTAKPVGGVNTPMFRAGNTNTLLGSGSAGTYYKIPFETERYDIGGCYNHTSSAVTLNGISVPSYSFAPNVAGPYIFGLRGNFQTNGSHYSIMYLYKNSSALVENQYANELGGNRPHNATMITSMNGTSDNVNMRVWQNSGSAKNFFGSGMYNSHFFGYLLKAD